jgi:phospholipase A1
MKTLRMHATPRRFAVALAAGWWLGAAQAAPSDCVVIVDPTARLQCYDREHGRSAAPPAASSGTPIPSTLPPADAEPSRLARRWDLPGAPRGELFVPRAHRPVYLLPVTWTDRVNVRPSSPSSDHTVTTGLPLREVEAKYQISLKAKLGQNLFGTPASLWAGYTQSSRWQLYNGADSRPFRETNYEPELIGVWPLDVDVLGWKWRFASLSVAHQSNGRALPLSRSWNRVIAGVGFERGPWVAELRPWWRIGEDADDDDNPDIGDHLGRVEFQLGRYWGDDHALTLQLRHSLRSGARSRGSAQLEWVFPLSDALHGYLQWFGGYGESLIDYNFRQHKLGLGVTIAGWR